MASNTHVLCKFRDTFCIVTLNRPKAMNAMSRDLRRSLANVMRAIASRSDMRTVILTGAGDRAFSAGLDLKELSDDPAFLTTAVSDDVDDNPLVAMGALKIPVIGAINGHAITGGFELALACDILIASENASFTDTHSRVGVVPGWGLTQYLTRSIGSSRANEMHFSARSIDARTAADWGLVNRVVSAEMLMPEAEALARQISKSDPEIVAEIKRVVQAGNAVELKEGLAIEAEASRDWAARLNQVVNPLT